ncbi:MAG TPA: hypothetical protein VIF09_23685 [Polyangiaceae bacterium]|jgi:hypothetical protein
MMHARVCDPSGPRAWRVAALVGALPLAVLAAVLPIDNLARVVMMLLGVAWLVAGRVVVPRLRPRPCVVEVEPGAIRIRHAGMCGQRLHARDVKAASTAQLDGGYALGLVRHADGDCPLWLEMRTREDLDRVRKALGVGHLGFGTIMWPPQRGLAHTTATGVDIAAALGWLGIVGATLLRAVGVVGLLAIFVLPITIIALVLAIVRQTPRGVLCLGPPGVRAEAGPAGGFAPWSAVRGARVERGGIAVETTSGQTLVPIDGAIPREREHLAAQIASGGQRAVGKGSIAPDVPASVAVLAPRDEPTRAWLERIDATAATLASKNGYRDVDVAEGDLWDTLESPDAPTPLRAAAARILARVDAEGSRARIARAVEMEHDTSARDQLCVALEDSADVAAEALETLRKG